MAGRIYVGVGGWTFEPWRGSFYPDDLPQKREAFTLNLKPSGVAARHLAKLSGLKVE